MKPRNEKILMLCPLKETKVYERTCLKECTWYQKGKCPIWPEAEEKGDSES